MVPVSSIVISTMTSPSIPDASDPNTGSGDTTGRAGRISGPAKLPYDSDPYKDPAAGPAGRADAVSFPTSSFGGGGSIRCALSFFAGRFQVSRGFGWSCATPESPPK